MRVVGRVSRPSREVMAFWRRQRRWSWEKRSGVIRREGIDDIRACTKSISVEDGG